MKQMNIAEQRQVQLDYEAANISYNIGELRPVIFKEGKLYRCLLGPNLQEGIAGVGNTLNEALADWEQQLNMRIAAPRDDDEVAQYASELLTASNKKVW